MGNAPAVPIEPVADNGEQNYERADDSIGNVETRDSRKDHIKESVPLRKAATRVIHTMKAVDNMGDDDVNAIDLLFQFIPYYGQGDAGNDSIVRSTLSALSVEEIDAPDSYGNTLLLSACQYRCEPLVRIILNKGADPNAVNSSGATCLHYACYKDSQSKSIARMLLQNGANPEVPETSYGCTPLHYCASTGDVDFCKMLLSYGAQVGTTDYYDYTAVDYARQSNMHQAASFLQKKLLMTASQGPVGFAAARGNMSPHMNQLRMNNPMNGSPNAVNNASYSTPPKKSMHDDSEWLENIDPSSGSKYYMNLTNGECLWESDYMSRQASMQFVQEEKDLFGDMDLERVESPDHDVVADTLHTSSSSPKKHIAPYSQPGHPTKKSLARNGSFTTSMDPEGMKRLLNEAKLQADEVLNRERSEFRAAIADKDGIISKLESECKSLQMEKVRIEGEVAELRKRLDMSSLSGVEAVSRLQEAIDRLETENTALKTDLHLANSTLDIEQEKLRSLQNTLSTLESSHEDRIQQEQQAAEERAAHMRHLEEQHALALKKVETQLNETKGNLQAELARERSENARIRREADERLEMYRIQRDRDFEELNNDTAEKLSKAARDLSSANSLAESCRKEANEANERADAAEEAQRAMVAEITEAREIEKYNAQLHRDLGREQKARKKLHNEIEDMKGKIRVYVRIRPLSNSEASKNCSEAVLKDGKMSVLVKGAQGPDSKKNFDFDQVFGGSSGNGNSQQDVFRDTKHLMLSVIDGYNVCIFAYGQTGSGKTFTMIGASDIGSCLQSNGEFDELAGITPRAVSEIFRLVNERNAQCSAEVSVQMFQLYRDGLEDLLKEAKGKKKAADDPLKRSINSNGQLKITLAEHSPTGLVHVEGAVSMLAETPADVMRIFELGAARRTTASTQMNAESSRSHLICTLVITLTNRRTGATTTGKLTLVDLAGSERVDKSGAQGEMLKEAQSINKSLSALGDVIAALTTGGNHIPYRNHPLTMLMSDSLGGNAKTLMFVNCSPADYNVSESHSSLSFATRCKDVRNATAAPGAMQSVQLSALKKELNKLKKENKGGGVAVGKLARPMG
mmetsp:Transcript_6450/g.9735  ORF Transcript_6450/g.9735 Transcript_6450/m.9735 type:complete len:1086 (+) Transcript_6450:167-3424(+)|eukprot:CAMPEP_0185037142 /NCGR_PEP_ID=MMETSP1103-20130426/31116_1 /TAXON_ID=36769 /ORGANISM="Paraphysomonas bandaiensis, Strain Caron Lab Isolate" /LENGTH=1085 /DNA_ID=CAMNT_0027574971 /DNA_START=92 /DNA_END=3349 /DNA_ORIENTATION=+